MRVWDLATGAQVGEPLTGHDGAVGSVAVSPDGTRIVSGGGDGWMRVAERVTGAVVDFTITGIGMDEVVAVAVTPDGTRIVSGGRNGSVRVWDLATGAQVGAPLTGHHGVVWSVAVSPDGTWIVSGGRDGSVRVWDLATGALAGALSTTQSRASPTRAPPPATSGRSGAAPTQPRTGDGRCQPCEQLQGVSGSPQAVDGGAGGGRVCARSGSVGLRGYRSALRTCQPLEPVVQEVPLGRVECVGGVQEGREGTGCPHQA